METMSNKCSQCGAVLPADDLARPACGCCGAALPHQVIAAQKAAVVREILADRDGDGVPDIFQSMESTGGQFATSDASFVNVISEDTKSPAVVMYRSSAPIVTEISIDSINLTDAEPRRSPAVLRIFVVITGALLLLGAAVYLVLFR